MLFLSCLLFYVFTIFLRVFFYEFSIWTYFVLCWFACLFVCLFVCYFLRRRRGGSLELRGNGAHLKEIGTRVGTELQCIVVAVG